ncbi:MAG: hypothetical protein IJ730_04390 [Alphaproteobacteria bacterium]|nr:hypothetical protein [Alphaproteobacteria bacterium]
MDASDDSDIGEKVEAKIESEPPKPKRKRNNLSQGERFRLIQAFQNGKTDKYYNVVHDKKRQGEYRIVKRRKPLDIPEIDEQVGEMPAKIENEPPKTQTAGELLKEDKPSVGIEFFSMQSNLNNSIQRELQSLSEKYDQLSKKFEKSRREQPKVVKKVRKESSSDDYQEIEEREYINPEPPQPELPPKPRFWRPRIDIRDF